MFYELWHLSVEIFSGEAPLHEAAFHGRDALLQMLLDHDADVNSMVFLPRDLKATPIHMAVFQGQYSTVRLLREAGADVNIQGKLGKNRMVHDTVYEEGIFFESGVLRAVAPAQRSQDQSHTHGRKSIIVTRR